MQTHVGKVGRGQDIQGAISAFARANGAPFVCGAFQLDHDGSCHRMEYTSLDALCRGSGPVWTVHMLGLDGRNPPTDATTHMGRELERVARVHCAQAAI